MPPNFSASLLMNITFFDFQSGPNTNCSEFRLPMTQLYKVFQSNVSISLDLCIGHKFYKIQVSTKVVHGYGKLWSFGGF